MNMGEVEKKTQSGELNIEHVSIEFNTVSGDKMKALDDISLDVAHGELVAVVGRSGCGKTTLLNIVAGLLEPTGGTCRLNGKEITGPGRERGVVFQADAVFGWKRVGDNVDFALKLGGSTKRRARAADNKIP